MLVPEKLNGEWCFSMAISKFASKVLTYFEM